MPEEMVKKYKPRWYTVNVAVNIDASGVVPPGATNTGSITIQNVPFILRRVTAANLGPSNLNPPPPLTAWAEIVPEFWAVSMRTDSHVYMSNPTVVVAAFGTVFDFLDCPSPVELQPKATVTFDVENLAERIALTTLQLVLHGVEPAEQIPERL